jgi:NTE family protein
MWVIVFIKHVSHGTSMAWDLLVNTKDKGNIMSANEKLPNGTVTPLFEESEIARAKNNAETISPIQTDAPDLQLVKNEEATSNRNGIALALGGGVARGWSHIGVLRALDEANIPISMIAGTSIGAVVGGCYLAGKLDELEEFARSITRRNILRYIDFTLGKSGFIAGNRLAERLDHELGDIRIEDLSKRFIAVATEIETGHEVWLEHGELAPAIRASYALPGVFQPVTHMGKHLVDGALVNPVPVSACRSFEQKIVMAVNLDRETFARSSVVRSTSIDQAFDAENQTPLEEVPSSWLPFNFGSTSTTKKQKLGITGVMIEAFNIIQDRIIRSRLAGDPPDVTIRPKLTDIGLTDFHKAKESIELGYKQTKFQLVNLEDAGFLEAII